MRISVVIPVYNASPFLRECLESLRAQTLADWEAICLDDGSTDDSLAILRDFAQKDPRFRVETKPNSGYGATVNLGLRHSRGKYVAILEPDDRLASPDVYEKLLGGAEQLGAEIVKGDYHFWWSGRGNANGLRERAFSLRSLPAGGNALLPLDAQTRRGLFALPLSVWSALYLREFLLRENIFFNETKGASFQDNAFSFKIFVAAKRVALADVPVVDYRQDNAASSIKSPDKVFCIADELHEIERWLRSRGGDAWDAFRFEFFLFKYKAYFANLLRIPRERRREFFALFLEEFRAARERGELPPELFSRLKKRLPLLLDKPEKFLRYARFQQFFNAFKRAKRHVFSVRRSRESCQITLCGKTFVF